MDSKSLVPTDSTRIFLYKDGQQVRTVEENGEIWFVAKDIAQALDYSESSINQLNNLFVNVPAIWADHKPIMVRSENDVLQSRNMLCLTEQGVYFFLGRSDKPNALPYQMWIAGEVVPSIRKHGAYMTPQTIEDMLADPDMAIRLLQELKAERIKVKALQEQSEKDRPKVIFAEAVDASKNSILIGELAKILRQNGINIGQNRLFAWLRNNGYLCKFGERYNSPTQSSMDSGFFEVKVSTVNNADGSIRTVRTTKVTGKGQIHFVNLFKTGKAKVM